MTIGKDRVITRGVGKMRKISILLLALALALGLSACGGSGDQSSSAGTGSEQAATSDIIVIYFSATGNTEKVAGNIADLTGADIYKIKAAEPYTDEDIDYGDNTRSSKEQNDPDARPEIGGEDVDLSAYSTVFIGYPIWYGQAPRIMDTFAEGHDFDGKTVIPFCTSENDDIGTTADRLVELAGSGDWKDGKRFAQDASEEDVQSWIEELGIIVEER